MKIFTYYDSSICAPANQSEMIRIWAHSWAARGWTPRLLTERHAKASRLWMRCKSADVLPFAALEFHGGGFFCAPSVVNFSLTGKDAKARTEPGSARIFNAGSFSGLMWLPRPCIDQVMNLGLAPVQTWPGICLEYREPGWLTAPLVHFDSDMSFQQIVDCGREVSLC